MHMKRTPTLANKGSRKREPHKLMLKTWRTLETRLIVQQCAQQHILLNYVYMQTKKETKLLNSYQRNQGYQKTWSAQRIQTIVKHASRPLLQNTTVDCPYNSRQKLRHPWPCENVETQKLSHTEGRKITSTLTKCLDLADTLQNTEAFTSVQLCAPENEPFDTSPLCDLTGRARRHHCCREQQ